MDIQGDLAKLEHVLIYDFSPCFLSIVYIAETNTIVIKIARSQFKHLTIDQRIDDVFTLLKFKQSDIIKNYTICVMAYDDKEINEIMETII